MRGNEEDVTKIKLSAKWKKLLIMFQRVKKLATLFLKLQLARLIYLSSATMVSLSFNSPNKNF
jgi:hypothetical protein